MNLKILFLLVFYYSAFILVFAFAGDSLVGIDSNIELENSELTDNNIEAGGIFGTGVSFSRFTLFTSFGIGLSDDTPSWFSLMFAVWQTGVLLFTIGFIVDSIWSG